MVLTHSTGAVYTLESPVYLNSFSSCTRHIHISFIPTPAKQKKTLGISQEALRGSLGRPGAPAGVMSGYQCRATRPAGRRVQNSLHLAVTSPSVPGPPPRSCDSQCGICCHSTLGVQSRREQSQLPGEGKPGVPGRGPAKAVGAGEPQQVRSCRGPMALETGLYPHNPQPDVGALLTRMNSGAPRGAVEFSLVGGGSCEAKPGVPCFPAIPLARAWHISKLQGV